MTEPRSKRESRSDTVYKALRDELMGGALAPDERLGEERLADRYGVSRTPVREALARLQADGLVERRDTGLFPYRPRRWSALGRKIREWWLWAIGPTAVLLLILIGTHVPDA